MAKKATRRPAGAVRKAVKTLARVAKRSVKAAPAAARTAARQPKASAAPVPRSRKHVYFFGDGKAEGNRTMRDLLGGKGANLQEMTNAGLPVPPGFTISTDVCTIYYEEKGRIPAAIDAEIQQAVKKLE